MHSAAAVRGKPNVFSDSKQVLGFNGFGCDIENEIY
jgi:hypothetical protein